MTPRDPKEIKKLKQTRRNALLNLTAARMGFKSWSEFGSQFAAALSALPDGATEDQVNAEIDMILSKTLDTLTHREAKKTLPIKSYQQCSRRPRACGIGSSDPRADNQSQIYFLS